MWRTGLLDPIQFQLKGWVVDKCEMELTMELESGNYDVVIAPYSEHATVESSSEVSGSVATSYLPVALDGDEENIANQSYSKVMVADKDEIKHYLKAIHKTLKSKT